LSGLAFSYIGTGQAPVRSASGHVEREPNTMHQIFQQNTRIQIGALQVAMTFCTLVIALLHLYLAVQPDEAFRFWFILNSLGYLGLLTVFFLPRFVAQHHRVSFMLAGYALLTIVLWFIFGQPDALIASVINPLELVLAVLAFYEGWRVLHMGSTNFV